MDGASFYTLFQLMHRSNIRIYRIDKGNETLTNIRAHQEEKNIF